MTHGISDKLDLPESRISGKFAIRLIPIRINKRDVNRVDFLRVINVTNSMPLTSPFFSNFTAHSLPFCIYGLLCQNEKLKFYP